MHRINPVFASAFLALVLTACGTQDDTLAEVNGEPIHRSDFQAYLKLKRVDPDDDKAVRRYKQEYLEREAIAGIAERSEYVDSGLARAELNEFRKQMVISRHFENYLREKVTPEAVRNYYASHPEEFRSEQVKVAHILIRTNPAMSKEERQARLTRARDLHSKLMQGAEFGALAGRYSQDTVSAKQDGSLGWLKRGAIDPVFSERAFALQPGQVSEPFATPFGFHIIKAEQGVKTVETPFESVKGDIRYRLRQAAKDAEMKRLLSEAEIKQ